MRVLFPAAVLLSAALASAQVASLPLIPMPRQVTPGTVLALRAGIRIDCNATCDAEDVFAIADLKQTLSDRHISVTTNPSAPHILVTRYASDLGRSVYRETAPQAEAAAMPAAMVPEGYAIQPDADGIALTGATPAGVFYALQTVKQMITGDGAGAALHVATVRDWPAMKYRGLHDDLSRGPVDSLEFQKKLIRTLAAYKVNLYSPYFESTQQYPSLPLVGVPGASMSPSDARELVAYATQYHIVVVPEQEAFGHLRHMLIEEQFAGAAETPHGAVLAPGQPQSMQMIDSMFKDLAAMYPGPFLHVGGDETDDLGVGRTRTEVDQHGLGAVYLDFVNRIVTDLAPLHRKILFWGDVAQNDPQGLKAMPASFRENAIAVAWGYSPLPNFSNYLKPFANSGIPFWVAPSINNYRQIWPNQERGLLDIQGFTRDGQAMGSEGQLNTLWDDDGESLANANWYGILFGAAAAWQKGESSIPQFKSAFGPVFHGDDSGAINQAQDEMTAAMKLLHDAKVIGDTEGSDGLFWEDPWSKDGQAFAVSMRPIAAALRLHAEHAIALVEQTRMQNPNVREQDALDGLEFGARRLDFLGLIYQLSDEMIDGFATAQATLAADPTKHYKPSVPAMLSDINGVNGRLQDLTYGYSQLRDMYEKEWMSSYRPANLRPVLERYDYTISLWMSRIDKARVLQREWYDGHRLTPVDVAAFGIPAPLKPVPPSPLRISPRP